MAKLITCPECGTPLGPAEPKWPQGTCSGCGASIPMMPSPPTAPTPPPLPPSAPAERPAPRRRPIGGAEPTEERSARHRLDRSRADKRKRLLTALLWCAVPIVLVILFLVFGGDGGTRAAPPQPDVAIDDTIDSLRTLWNGGDIDAVKTFIAASERPRLIPNFDKIVYRRKWREGTPTAGEPEVTHYSGHQVVTEFSLEGYGAMRIEWEWEEPRWVIVHFRFRMD